MQRLLSFDGLNIINSSESDLGGKLEMKGRHCLYLHNCTIIVFLLSAFTITGRSQGRLIDVVIESKKFSHNKIGISAKRNVTVYLPEHHDDKAKRFPVIYYLHNFFEDNRSLFSGNDSKALFDKAIKDKVISDVIVVSADFGTPVGGSFYINSSVTGNWEDFMVEELVPYIDANFKTLPQKGSRGIAGDRMGGYGAFRFGMQYSNVFGSVYALHPVGTGTGLQIMHLRPNWDVLAKVTSTDDLKDDVFSQIFTAMFQAHLPNPNKAPLFVDLPAHRVGNQLVIDVKLTERLHNSFFLERMIPRYAENIKSLRGLKFDWGCSDPNADHVYANQAFTHKLNEYGIAHESEEYNGGWGDKHWGEHGRVYTDVLPFFRKHLIFEPFGTAVLSR